MGWLKIILSLAAVLPSVAFAGEWSSGGGVVLRNANNPWFLKNTKEVSYCIKSDTKAFAEMPTPLLEIVDNAFSFWKKQMSDAYAATNCYGGISKDPSVECVIIDVATQKFNYAPKCTGHEDVVFQFGVADAKQRKFLGRSNDLIGAAVRTDYDETSLRGKGFIYIAADSGPHAYQGEHLRPHAWHEGKSGLLFRAVVHELGHVFGLSHGTDGIMSEYYSESLLRDHAVPAGYADSFDLPSIFHFELSPLRSEHMLGSSACEHDLGKKLFGSEFRCWDQGSLIHLKEDGKNRFLLIMRPKGGDEKILGTLEGKTELRVPGRGYGVSVVLTDKQDVFSKAALNNLRLRGPEVHSGRFAGKFTPTAKDGKSFTAVLILSPDAVTFDGIVDGNDITDIFTWTFSSLGDSL